MGLNKQLRVDHAEAPVKEIWSRLSFFESEYNSKEFLRRFGLTDDDLSNVARSLAFTMRTAREYYEAADQVTILTRPLLVFYGMTALAKTLFVSTHGKKSPSTRHGLQKIKEWSGAFAELSVSIPKDGTFPQFHGCYSKQDLYKMTFSIKELMSLVPETKVEFETVYNEKSQALRILRNPDGVHVVDSELSSYVDLANRIFTIPGVNEMYRPHAYEIENKLILYYSRINPQAENPVIRAVSGEEYLVLPLKRNESNVSVPELSAHFLIMYLLGMLSRYQPEEWGEIIKGEETGEIYIIRKFIETTIRKFPNLVLNELRNRNFVFLSPSIETPTKKRLDENQLRDIYDYVSRKLGEEFRRGM